MNIFAKAAQGLNLSPAERAFLKLLKGWFYTALGTGIITGSQYVMGTAVIDWQKLLYIVGTGVLLSILSALDKFWSSQGDTPLALATEAAIQKVQTLPPPQSSAISAPVLTSDRLAQLSQARPPAPEPIVLQPRQQSVAPSVPQVAQVPFPLPVSTVASNPQTIKFGDTGIVPTVK